MLSWKEKTNPAPLAAFARIHPFTRLDALLRRYFRHPNTLAMFRRYATYVGGSPSASPAIFAMLAHVESGIGIYGVRGGTYELVRAFVRLAEETGVSIQYKVRVEQVHVRSGRAAGVATSQGDYSADSVIIGGDLLSAHQELLPPEHRKHMTDARLGAYEPSLLDFVILAGVPQAYDGLVHHNILFPEHYGQEFDDIFRLGRPAADPALYICNSSFTDLKADTSAYRGAIYGISANRWSQTFFRPSNKSRDVEGLWFVGGTTHPGGGTPIVVMSGQQVAGRIIQESQHH